MSARSSSAASNGAARTIARPCKVKVTDELIAFADRLFGQKCAELG